MASALRHGRRDPGRLDRTVRAWRGPVLLAQPWHEPPRRARFVDCVGIHHDLEANAHVDPAIGYESPAGHFAWIESVRLAVNAHDLRILANAGAGHPATSYHDMYRWVSSDAVAMRLKLNGQPLDQRRAGVLRDRAAHLDGRELGWKAAFDDITPDSGNLVPGQVVYEQLPYVPALPGRAYTAAHHPKGYVTHGLSFAYPVRVLLQPGNRLTVELDARAYDITTFCAGVDALGAELVTDPGLEAWTTTTDLTYYTELRLGSSWLQQDTSFKRSGASSVDMGGFDTGDDASFSQTVSGLKAATNYRFSFWHVSVFGTGQILYQIQDPGGLYLQADGSWAAPTYSFVVSSVPTYYAQVVKDFTSNGAGGYTCNVITQPIGDLEEWFIDDWSVKEKLESDHTRCVNLHARLTGWSWRRRDWRPDAEGVRP